VTPRPTTDAVADRADRLVRRFVALSALGWLPTGLTLPVLVILMQDRGLSLGEVGGVTATFGLTVMLCELPTGGLADAAGRRPVLLGSAALDLAALAITATAAGPAAFLAGAVIRGVGRALDSGPLESWFVDAALAIDRDADIERGLGRAGTAIGLALAAGSLASAGLAAGSGVVGVDPLVVPLLAAIAARLVHMVALAHVLAEPRRTRPGAIAAGISGAPRVVGSTLRLVAGSSALLALVGVEVLWGAGLTGLELLTGPRLVDVLGSASEGVLVFGFASAAGWLASAAGSAAVARGSRAAKSDPVRLAVSLRFAQGAAVGLMAMVGGAAGLVTGYVAFYVVHGGANVVHYGMVHRLVDGAHRTTVLSAHSLAARLGAIPAGAGLGALAGAAGVPAALGIAAALLAAPAPLYVVAGRGTGRLALGSMVEGTFGAPQGSTERDRDTTYAGGGPSG
jgi:MFS family permease